MMIQDDTRITPLKRDHTTTDSDGQISESERSTPKWQVKLYETKYFWPNCNTGKPRLAITESTLDSCQDTPSPGFSVAMENILKPRRLPPLACFLYKWQIPNSLGISGASADVIVSKLN